MAIIFKGFTEEELKARIAKIIKERPVHEAKWISNIADIVISDGNINLVKKEGER